MADLWPNEITVDSKLKSPVSILKEQGVLLGKKTKNLVIGNVINYISEKSDNFIFGFELYSTPLNYHYELFRISYGVELYPVKVYSSGSKDFDAINEEYFLEILKQIFSDTKTVRIINSLISQSKEF